MTPEACAVVNLAEVSPGPRDVCYSKGMAGSEFTFIPVTEAQTIAGTIERTVDSLWESFSTRYEAGEFDTPDDVKAFLEAYREGVKAALI